MTEGGRREDSRPRSARESSMIPAVPGYDSRSAPTVAPDSDPGPCVAGVLLAERGPGSSLTRRPGRRGGLSVLAHCRWYDTNDHWLEPMPITAGNLLPRLRGRPGGGPHRASGSGGANAAIRNIRRVRRGGGRSPVTPRGPPQPLPPSGRGAKRNTPKHESRIECVGITLAVSCSAAGRSRPGVLGAQRPPSVSFPSCANAPAVIYAGRPRVCGGGRRGGRRGGARASGRGASGSAARWRPRIRRPRRPTGRAAPGR